MWKTVAIVVFLFISCAVVQGDPTYTMATDTDNNKYVSVSGLEDPVTFTVACDLINSIFVWNGKFQVNYGNGETCVLNSAFSTTTITTGGNLKFNATIPLLFLPSLGSAGFSFVESIPSSNTLQFDAYALLDATSSVDCQVYVTWASTSTCDN